MKDLLGQSTYHSHSMARKVTLLVLLGCFLLSFSSPAYASKQSDIESHQSKAEAARKKAAAEEAKARQLASEIKSLDSQIDSYEKQAASLNPKIREATRRTLILTQELRELQSKEQSLRADIKATTDEYNRQQALLGERVVSSYKNGDSFIIELLLNASSFKDFITRTEYITRVLSSNAEFARELEQTRRQLESDKVELERIVSSARQKQQEAASNERNLRTMQASQERAAANSEALQDQKAGLMSQSKKNAARLRAMAEEEESTARRLQSQLSGNGSGVFKGRMVWPVPGYNRVSSPFGYRIHPIFGTRKLHTGVDIGRKADGTSIDGAAIVASASGTVHTAAYLSGYGYTIILDHGNGVTTLYPHQRAGGFKVSRGQRVKAGQRIGTVGSTGNSTGAHLHWEVRVNGVPKNPLTY